MHKLTLMIQGTASNAGKSAVTAGLCRMLARRGVTVAPFKPQNMALNSAVTTDGGEIGRAQAVQAEACGIAPHSDMNPILLKPNSQTGAQVIIQGKVHGNMNAVAYHLFKKEAMSFVLESYRRLCTLYDCIVVEGAGSPAELNLREGDIANMGFAEAVDCPVILVADIDRGGVFAQIAGTMRILSQSERDRVGGFIVNKFRGDVSLLASGLHWLEQETGKPVLGVLPFLEALRLDSEDSLSQPNTDGQRSDALLNVVVVTTPRLSNHTDFDALSLQSQVNVRFLKQGQALPQCDLVILGGSKNVRDDLQFIVEQGWDIQIKRHLRYGGKLIGICGGFQMLGNAIHDPFGLESEPGSSPGLGLLDVETTLQPEKKLTCETGTLLGAKVSGYEIHMGISSGPALARAAVQLPQGPDGAISCDDQVLGTYLHGIFDHPEACQALMQWAGVKAPCVVDYRAVRDREIDRLADLLESNLDLVRLSRIMNFPLGDRQAYCLPVFSPS